MTSMLHAKRPLTRLSLLATACLLVAPAHAAVHITTDRTVASGSAIQGNLNFNTVVVGSTSQGQPVRGLTVDVVAPASLGYSDQSGGGMLVFSDARVNWQGGTSLQLSANGNGGGLALHDSSLAVVSGGELASLHIWGTAGSAARPQARVEGGLISNDRGVTSIVSHGQLVMTGGTLRSTRTTLGGQAALAANDGTVISIQGGLVSSAAGQALAASGTAQIEVSGGRLVSGAADGFTTAVYLSDLQSTAQLRGGVIDGGLRARQGLPGAPNALQAVLSDQVQVQGSVIAAEHAQIEVRGGRYSASFAEFVALGSEDITFVGQGLTLSGPVAATFWDINPYAGSVYTFTGGTLADGRSAVGLRVFDAAAAPGGITLATTPVPEPSAWWLAVAGAACVARRNRRTARVQQG